MRKWLGDSWVRGFEGGGGGGGGRRMNIFGKINALETKRRDTALNEIINSCRFSQWLYNPFDVSIKPYHILGKMTRPRDKQCPPR